MSNDRLKYLLERYCNDASTPEETWELFKWIRDLEDDTQLKERVKTLWTDYEDNELMPNVNWDAIYTEVLNLPVIGKRSIWPRVWAAAVVGALLGGVGYYVFKPRVEQNVEVTAEKRAVDELLPGGDRAVLTLADGRQIILDSSNNGTLSEQGNTRINKLDKGQVSYVSLDSNPEEVLYNTIATPRGGQYQVMLADGSKVWLNAASSLRFPVSFTGDSRTVTLSGEGYFEVAHDAAKPFAVLVNGVEVHVLGTHFNINAYTDEGDLKTTLLEGSVKISKGVGIGRIISPGEQAIIGNSSMTTDEGIAVRQVDVDAVTAWRNGRFVFKGDNIQSVMRQLARWYDAEISYAENVTNEEFVGVINRSRYDDISDILEMLTKTGAVSFSTNGRHITVMPFKK